MQANFSDFKIAVALVGLVGLAVPCAAAPADDLSKNIVVLVDSSGSVDPANRKSALLLVAGLVEGKVDQDNRPEWIFNADEVSDPQTDATVNLSRFEGGPIQPLAAKNAQFVIAPLGNYQRVVDLRDLLDNKMRQSGSPEVIAGKLKCPDPPFTNGDGSTHLSLAQAVVAQTFLNPPAKTPYYLIVISDFKEDCLARDTKEYSGEAFNTLKKWNSEVFSGVRPYVDSKGIKGITGKYSPEDQAAIKFLSEKIDGLLIGKFTYDVKNKPALPVEVRIFSPVVKRTLEFAKPGDDREWILPDPAPEWRLKVEGIDGNPTVEVEICKNGSAEPLLRDFQYVIKDKTLKLGEVLAQAGDKVSGTPGTYGITLKLPRENGVTATAATQLTVIHPKLLILARETSINAQDHPVGKPYEFPEGWNFGSDGDQISFKLDPAPTVDREIEVGFPEGKDPANDTVRLKNGQGTFKGLLPPADHEQELLHLTAKLKMTKEMPKCPAISSEPWLKIPKLAVGADCAKIQDEIVRKVEGATTKVELKMMAGGGLLKLQANFDGVWTGTKITPSTGWKSQAPDEILITSRYFSDTRFTVESTFEKQGAGAKNASIEVTVIVPKNPPWKFIAMGLTLALGLSLLAWHFFRRR